MSDYKIELGRRIAEVRKKNKDSQEVCAQKLGIKRGTLAAYETGSSAMPDHIKIKFVGIYNISYEYLISGSNVLEEPPTKYQQKDIVTLLDQLDNTPLHREIRRRVLALIEENNQQKDKIIQLLEGA